MKLMKIHIQRNLEKCISQLKTSQHLKDKIQKKFYINNLPHEVTFMKQNPFKNSQWAKLAQDGLEVVQIIETMKAGIKTFRYLGVLVGNQLYWYDSKEPFRLQNRSLSYSKASNDGFG